MSKSISTIQAYAGKLGAIHKKLVSSSAADLADRPCNEATLLAKSQKKELGAIRLRTIYGPFLARFAAFDDKSLWAEDKGAWAWLTDMAFAGHFAEHPSKREPYSVNDTAKRVTDDYEKERFVVVIWPTDPKQNRMPVYHADTKAYEGGVFTGHALIVDQNDASIACAHSLSVTTSKEISYRTGGRRLGKLLDEKPEEAVRNDFEDNIEGELKKFLPEHVSVTTSFGKLFN